MSLETAREAYYSKKSYNKKIQSDISLLIIMPTPVSALIHAANRYYLLMIKIFKPLLKENITQSVKGCSIIENNG